MLVFIRKGVCKGAVKRKNQVDRKEMWEPIILIRSGGFLVQRYLLGLEV